MRENERVQKPRIANVLASRYASLDMATLWSPEHKIVLERQLWIAVLRAQRDLGVEVPDGVIEAYEAVVDQVSLPSIAERERITRHDVKARIEEFAALAGFEHVHKGMTSRDLTENVEQMQVRRGLEIIEAKTIAVLVRLGQLATQHASLVMAGRSHNVAAQATTLGKRRAGVPAIARLRCADVPGPAGGRAVEPGHDHPADGRPRAGDGGLQARPSWIVGYAA